MKAPRSILVRTPNWIGDQILAYPFFHFLRKSYPNARIAVACVSWVESVQFLNLVDEVHVLPKPNEPGFLARIRALEQGAAELRAKGPWDLGISLPNSFSAAWTLKRAGAVHRRGFSVDARGWLLTDRLNWTPSEKKHRADAYLDLLPAACSLPATEFFGIPASNELDSDIPGEIAEFDAERAWPEAAPLDAPAEPYWVLAPGAAAESRRWPVEFFRAVAEQVAADTRLRGFVVGGLAELPLAEELCRDPALRLTDLTAQGPPTALWKIFRGARFTLSNDSGLAHVASLCGSPVQIVWGAGLPTRTQPIGPGRARVVFNPVACWPCESNECAQPPGRKIECLRGIRPDAVWKEIQSGLFRR
ncbi:MAG: glycosyltransferase family 9 protein [Oligoflexia bacterium]|nr:glycosyltransferase family 9 protein [Oligoflexia bacterium]